MTAFAVQLPHVEPIDSDLHLARRCAAGDADAFESIYHAHADRMKSIAYHHLGNVADAEDAVQETFLKIHRAASTYTGEAAFATWLYRILVNTCYDAMRRRRRRPHVASNVDDTKRIMLARLLRELPEQRRTVFVLFEIEGFSHAEIAEIAGISEANSKWILFSTRRQLQEKWKHEH